jgi:hypothetical protein
MECILWATIGAMPVGRTTPGFAATRVKRITTMMRKLAAAVIAVSLIASPVLAQGMSNAPTTTGQPKAKVDTVKTTEPKVTKTKKHAAMIRHHRKHFAHVKHVKQLKQVKRFNHPAKNKVAG